MKINSRAYELYIHCHRRPIMSLLVSEIGGVVFFFSFNSTREKTRIVDRLRNFIIRSRGTFYCLLLLLCMCVLFFFVGMIFIMAVRFGKQTRWTNETTTNVYMNTSFLSLSNPLFPFAPIFNFQLSSRTRTSLQEGGIPAGGSSFAYQGAIAFYPAA